MSRKRRSSRDRGGDGLAFAIFVVVVFAALVTLGWIAVAFDGTAVGDAAPYVFYAILAVFAAAGVIGTFFTYTRWIERSASTIAREARRGHAPRPGHAVVTRDEQRRHRRGRVRRAAAALFVLVLVSAVIILELARLTDN